MVGDEQVEEPVTPTGLALGRLREAVDGFIAAVETGGLDHLDAPGKMALLSGLEEQRRRLPVAEHALIADAQVHDLAGRYAFASLSMMLVKTLRLSPGEAAARVSAAEAVGGRVSMLGQPLAPLRPVVAAAQRAGEVSTEQVGIITRALAELPSNSDPADVAEAEQTLTGHARVFGPKELRLIARRLVDAADPDGPAPDDTVPRERRHLELRPLRDGTWRVEGRLTAETGAALSALLSPLAKPLPPTPGPTTKTGKSRPEPDLRHYGQRLHDALDEVAARLLRSTDLPMAGGTPATVIVTIDLADLLRRAGIAETADGTLLSPEQLLRIAGEADIWTAITDAHGVPLALGRTRRIASRGQTIALAARDGGCSFPGCTRPPSWCDRHHILDWIFGGRTDLNNLTLLCRHHHTHFAQRGWTCRLNPAGLPEWIPPRWIDRHQRPLLHERIQRRHAEHTLIA